MELYDERLRSFSTGNRPWPHPPTFQARPETLADAGFYFAPSAGWPDNVVCFLCKKELGSWEMSEKPLEQHLGHTKNCGFAISKLPPNPFDWDNPNELPQGDRMYRARLQTFGKWWPHDQVKGFNGTSEKMARAGFIFCPTDESADNAQCSYCSAALEGWEPDDDPVHEHKRRFPHCPFFAVRPTGPTTKSTSQSAASLKPTKKRSGVTKTAVKKEQTLPKATAAPTRPTPTIVSAMKGHSNRKPDLSPARSVDFELIDALFNGSDSQTGDSSKSKPLTSTRSSGALSTRSETKSKPKESTPATVATGKASMDTKSTEVTGLKVPSPLQEQAPSEKQVSSKKALSVGRKPKEVANLRKQPSSDVHAASKTPSDSKSEPSSSRNSTSSTSSLATTSSITLSQSRNVAVSVVIKKRKLTEDEREFNRERWSHVAEYNGEDAHADMVVGSPSDRVTSPGTASESSPFMDVLETSAQSGTVAEEQTQSSDQAMTRQVAKRRTGRPGRHQKAIKLEETEVKTVPKTRRRPAARTATRRSTRSTKKAPKPLIEILMEDDPMESLSAVASEEDAANRAELPIQEDAEPHMESQNQDVEDIVVQQETFDQELEPHPDESAMPLDEVDLASPSPPSTPPRLTRQSSVSPPSTPVRDPPLFTMMMTPDRGPPSTPLLSTPIRGTPSIPLLATPVRKQAVSLLDIENAKVVVVDPSTPIRRPASRADIDDWEDEEQPGSAGSGSHISSPFMSPSRWELDGALATSTPKSKRTAHIPGITPRQRVRDFIGNASMRSSTRRTPAHDSPFPKRTEDLVDLNPDLKKSQLVDRLETLMQGNATSEVFAVAEQALHEEVEMMRRSQNKERRRAAKMSASVQSDRDMEEAVMDTSNPILRTPVKQTRSNDFAGLDDIVKPRTPLHGTPIATVIAALGAASRRNNPNPFSPSARKTTDILKLSDLEPIQPPAPSAPRVRREHLDRPSALKATNDIADRSKAEKTAPSRPLFEDLDPKERERRLRLMDETGLTADQLSMTVEEFHRACIAEQVQALETAADAWILQFEEECEQLRNALMDASC
ncbi:hypothetical protein EMPS_09486 [Entomortierella parvispora]|uniref:BIR-domain-containing protein n=1 Tax=Entomortierella parvispora TaxID=205924 RepID=A0A9P3HI92_9FUNG|nr:hypothetical protein EMPS_09486 [Entomortierella parvispora]